MHCLKHAGSNAIQCVCNADTYTSWSEQSNTKVGIVRRVGKTHCKLGSRMVKSWNARDFRSCEEVSKSCATTLHSVSNCPGPAMPLALARKEGCCSTASLTASRSCSIPYMHHMVRNIGKSMGRTPETCKHRWNKTLLQDRVFVEQKLLQDPHSQ